MAKNMPVKTFYEWVAYSQIHPFGEARADLRAGILAATVYNVMVGLWAKHPKFKQPADFMPMTSVKKRVKSPTEIYQIFKMAIQASVKTIDKRVKNGK